MRTSLERADEISRDGGISKWKNAIRSSYRSDQDPGKLGRMDQPEDLEYVTLTRVVWGSPNALLVQDYLRIIISYSGEDRVWDSE